MFCRFRWPAELSRKQTVFPYLTVIVILAVERPYWSVVFSVYVVVAEGLTVALVPWTPPILSMKSKLSFVADQLSVTCAPALIVVLLAEKLEIAGGFPAGAVVVS